jgi:hypothetical protein
MSNEPIEQPDSMSEADVANGENPDDAHETGDGQAEENREKDPPA